MSEPRKARLATVWLDGCSGCHMSILDLDERLIELSRQFDLVYSPLVDAKEYPTDVDVVLVEGAVTTDEDEAKIRHVRARTKVLVSLGDCAVTSNVPSLRNPIGVDRLVQQAYHATVTLHPRFPTEGLPSFRPKSQPVHEVVPVDVFVPGCPPSAQLIGYVLEELLAGRQPDLTGRAWFGA